MKKVIILVFIIFFISGCSSKIEPIKNDRHTSNDDIQNTLDLVKEGLIKGTDGVADVWYNENTKSFYIKYLEGTEQHEALNKLTRIQNSKEIADLLEKFSKPSLEFANILTKFCGEGYSVITLNPIDDKDPPLYIAKDGVVLYPILN